MGRAVPREDPVEQYLDVSHRIGRRLLSVLIDVCETESIEFYVHAGTMLGCVRGSGWIPWDDDVDVVMFRSEFERFRLVCRDKLPDDVAFSDVRSNPSHLSSLARLLFLNSQRGQFARERNAVSPETVHVPLDIFVLDTTPGTRWATSLWRRAIYVLERLVYARSTSLKQTLRARQVVMALTVGAVIVSRLLPSSGWRRLHHEVCILPGRLSERSAVALMNDANKRFRRVVMAHEDFRPATYGLFEGLEVPLPARVEHVLCLIYGPDFIQPPQDFTERRPIHLRNGLAATIDGQEWYCPPSSSAMPRPRSANGC